MGVLLISILILSLVLSSKINRITELVAETTKQKLVEQSLRDYTGTVSSERDVAIAKVQELEKEVSNWKLKYYKCNRTNDHDCETEISRAMLLNAPDDEQGRLLYESASRYTSANQGRYFDGKAARSRLVVQ